ncbi:hypothetical protein ACMD2_19401 [Ananas comosus]|uniref:Uncharacterized protein n=1 Tax=Ananas comosus TaxID=4615 RepID=A0A199VRS4_ANACO|nr:hypothetical protein ACMD2_19401 [Ananas comosus]
MKWKDRRGTAKMATNRLIPEHWSGEKIPHHRTDPYARIIATYSGTTAASTVYRSCHEIILPLPLPLAPGARAREQRRPRRMLTCDFFPGWKASGEREKTRVALLKVLPKMKMEVTEEEGDNS